MVERQVRFEDIDIGSVERAGPYVLSAGEIKEFSSRWDPQDFHIDDEQADKSLFAGLAASGVHTVRIANLLLHDTDAGWDIRAMLGSEYRLPNPTRAGDELRLSRTVTDKRPGSSRPDLGVVTTEAELVNQNGLVVLHQQNALLVRRSGT